MTTPTPPRPEDSGQPGRDVESDEYLTEVLAVIIAHSESLARFGLTSDRALIESLATSLVAACDALRECMQEKRQEPTR